MIVTRTHPARPVLENVWCAHVEFEMSDGSSFVDVLRFDQTDCPTDEQVLAVATTVAQASEA